MNIFATTRSVTATCALLLCTLSANAQNTSRFITHKDGWYISSPSLHTPTSTKKTPHTNATLEDLQTRGTQAHTLWQKDNNPNALLAPFQELFADVDRDYICALIDSILEDEEQLERITAASYRNVIGFLKIVLADGGPESWKLRLHVWEQKEVKEFPHNHKWDFYSKILSGYLTQEVYERNAFDQADAVLHSVREPVSLMPIPEDGSPVCPCRDDYALEEKEQVQSTTPLRVASKDNIAVGESYVMPHHLIHTITPSRGAISFVFTSEKKTDNSEVFVPMDRVATDLSRNAPSVTKQELKEELLKIKALLEQLYIHPGYLPEMVDTEHRYYFPTDEAFQQGPWREVIGTTYAKKVVQLTNEQKKAYRVSADENGCMLIGGKAIDPTQDYLFVLDEQAVYAAIKDFHHQEAELVCHTSFTDYGPTKAVGVFQFDADGTLRAIEAYSGHYMPTVAHMQQMKDYLHMIGINTAHAVCIPYHNR